MSLLAKLKNLTDLCSNIKVKEEQTLDEITSSVDEALTVAREELEAGGEGLLGQNIERTHSSKLSRPLKIMLLKVFFHSQGNQLNILQVVALALQQI